MKFIDIPKQQILDEIALKIIHDFEEASSGIGIDIKIERVEWTVEGLRLWLKGDNQE